MVEGTTWDKLRREQKLGAEREGIEEKTSLEFEKAKRDVRYEKGKTQWSLGIYGAPRVPCRYLDTRIPTFNGCLTY